MPSKGQMPFKSRAVGVAELIRPHNVAASCLAALAGAAVASGSLGALIAPGYAAKVALAVLVVALVSAAGYVINDYFDVDIDSINKPWRPIPSGRVPAKAAYALALTLFTIGTALSALIGPLCFTLALLNSILLYAYSAKVKRTGLPGNMLVAFSSFCSILYGGLACAEAAGNPVIAAPSLIPAAYAFLLILGREIVKTVEDVKGDAACGARTLPVIMGVRGAVIVADALLAIVVAISVLPLVFLGYGLAYAVLALLGVDAIAVWTAVKLTKACSIGEEEAIAQAAKARSALKVALFLGILAFLFGATLP